MRQPYDFSEDVKTLRMPVMLVYGDSDMFRPEHIVEFYRLLGGGLRDAGWQRETMSQNRLATNPRPDALRRLRVGRPGARGAAVPERPDSRDEWVGGGSAGGMKPARGLAQGLGGCRDFSRG